MIASRGLALVGGFVLLAGCSGDPPVRAPGRALGEACETSTQCAANLLCVSQVCADNSCRAATDCAGDPGGTCSVWACVASSCVPGCFDGGPAADASTAPDASAAPDATAAPDAAVPTDTGVADSGAQDAGQAQDAAAADASSTDSGVVDSGPRPDSGVACDPVARAPSSGELLVNELLADPAASAPDGDANGDGVRSASDDEFVEIANVSASTLQLGGLVLTDSDDVVRHVFDPATLGCGEVVVVFGGGDASGPGWQANWVVASTGRLSLNNSGDTVAVGTSTSATGDILTTAYSGPVAADDQSVVRETELDGGADFIRHTLHVGSGGRRFSPGTRVDGAPF